MLVGPKLARARVREHRKRVIFHFAGVTRSLVGCTMLLHIHYVGVVSVAKIAESDEGAIKATLTLSGPTLASWHMLWRRSRLRLYRSLTY